jgi:surfactin synthase thioesterase subunit
LIEASGDWPLSPSRADFDMLTDIRAKIKRLPITVRWRWIKGHQDDAVSYDDLDDWAKANVLVDNVAKAYWNRFYRL